MAEQAGLQVGDVILKICGSNAEIMRHKEAQDAIYRAANFLELTIQRFELNHSKRNYKQLIQYL